MSEEVRDEKNITVKDAYDLGIVWYKNKVTV
jgi:hypothetical protein